MMSFTKFLDVVQEDNESISGAVSTSGADPGSHCFQQENILGFPGAFLLGSRSPKEYCGRGETLSKQRQPCGLHYEKTCIGSGW